MSIETRQTSEQERLQHLAEAIRNTSLFTGTTEADRMFEKYLLFLVAAGLKPAAWVASVHKVEVAPGVKHPVPDDEEQVKQFLDALGLHYSISVENDFLTAKVARTEAELVAAQSDDPAVFGRAMGYPETAVTAYIEGHDSISDEERAQLAEEQYGDRTYGTFAFFRLSRQHAKAELAVSKQWYDALKTYGMIERSPLVLGK